MLEIVVASSSLLLAEQIALTFPRFYLTCMSLVSLHKNKRAVTVLFIHNQVYLGVESIRLEYETGAGPFSNSVNADKVR